MNARDLPLPGPFVGPLLPPLHEACAPLSGRTMRAQLRVWHAEHAPLAKLIGPSVESPADLERCVLASQAAIDLLMAWVLEHGQAPREWPKLAPVGHGDGYAPGVVAPAGAQGTPKEARKAADAPVPSPEPEMARGGGDAAVQAAVRQLTEGGDDEPAPELTVTAKPTPAAPAPAATQAPRRMDPAGAVKRGWLSRLHGVIPPGATIERLSANDDPEKLRGKAPGWPLDDEGSTWEKYSFRAKDAGEHRPLTRKNLEYISKARGNFGIVLGSVASLGAGADTANLIAFDLDTDPQVTAALLPIALQFMREHCGEPMHRHGRKGRAMLIVGCDVALKKSQVRFTDGRLDDKGKPVVKKIELLGEGQQVVVDGTHPDGAPYRSAPLLDEISPGELPVLSHAQVGELLELLTRAALGGGFGLTLDSHGSAKAVNGGGSPVDRDSLVGSLEEVDELLTLIPVPDDRNGWVAIVHNIVGATLDHRDEGRTKAIDWGWQKEDGPQETAKLWDSIDPASVHTGIRALRHAADRPVERAEDAFDVLEGSDLGTTRAAGPNYIIIGDEPDEPAASRFVVRGLIGEADLVLVYGPPGSGKTFLASSLAVHVAARRDWMGHEVASNVGVIYLANEGSRGVRTRVRAQARRLGVALDTLPLAITLTPVNARANFDAVRKLIADAARRLIARFAIKHAMVIADTLMRTWGGVNDNAADDMAKVVEDCDTLRGMGLSVLLIHHPGKNVSLGARGHSSLTAAVDVSIAVDLEKERRTYKVEKMRDEEAGEHRAFRLERVQLRGQDGAEMSTAVLIDAGAPEARRSAIKAPSANNLAVIRALRVEVDEHGQIIDNGTPPLDRPQGISVDAWRSRYLASFGQLEKAERAEENRKFRRGKEWAIENGWAVQQGDHCWPIR